VLNPAIRIIRVSFQGFYEVQDGSDFPFRPEYGDHRLGPYVFRFCWSGPLEVLYPGNLPFRMNLRLLYSPLDPTSNGEVIHPGKMLLADSLPAFSHNQSGSAQSVLAGHLEKVEGVPELQRQTNPAPATTSSSGDNWATRTIFRTTPPSYCETSSTVGWRRP
jgi:hypothetical protein